MSIQLQWDHSTITPSIHMTFEKDWTLDAYYHSIAALDVMLDSQSVPFAIILDMTVAPTPPLRVPRGRQLDENRVFCRADLLVVVRAGHFMPHVTCPVEWADSLAAARERIGLKAASVTDSAY
jgi:hypothetical protein